MEKQDNDVEFGGGMAESGRRFLVAGMYGLGKTWSNVRDLCSRAGSDIPDRRLERHGRRRLYTNKYADKYADWRTNKYFDQHPVGNSDRNGNRFAYSGLRNDSVL